MPKMAMEDMVSAGIQGEVSKYSYIIWEDTDINLMHPEHKVAG